MKDGHLTKDLIQSNFAGVVSCESVRLAFAYAALNGLKICAVDIKSAYLQAPTSEKHYVRCGEGFPLERILRCNQENPIWWKERRCRLLETHEEMHGEFTPYKADPDVWMRQAKSHVDGRDYWEYILLYVDDALCISANPRAVLENKIGQYWKLKKDPIGSHTIYLENKVTTVVLETNVSAWSFSSSQYIQKAVKNVELHLRKSNEKLPSFAPNPFTSNYRPEIIPYAEIGASLQQ